MQELVEKIRASEANVPAGFASCIFLPRIPAKRLSLVFDIRATVPVEQKEILCALHLYSLEGAPLGAQGGSWPVSSRFQTAYQYLPALTDEPLVKLRSFASAEPFAAAVVHLHPWKRRFAEGDVSLLRCVASERVTLNGRHFRHYRDLSMLETARD